ncbi:RNA-binding protein 28 [Condylostylus longicornis]|uniref:RNA-binding protein 28 n=1 Tax=Condylostylus longicornis TaxID=2530218 RepID=UPI00244DB053|nr:RNA-binding protein 28 [Condylostylus longicornis]
MNFESNMKDEKDFIPLEAKKKVKVKANLKEQKERRRQKRGRIIVRNISYKATEDSFRDFFSKFGKIVDIKLLKRGDGKLVGCGFVQYETVNQAAKAISKGNNTSFLDRIVVIDWAIGKNEYEKRKNMSIKKELNREKEDISVTIKEEPSESESEIEKNESNSEQSDTEGNCTEESLQNENSESENYMDIDGNNSENGDKMEKKDIEKTFESKPKFKSNDIKEECTIFIKNVPFDATEDDLRKVCRKFGPIYYALINKDPISGHSRGTAFVKFKTKDSAEMCLRAGDEFILLDQIMEALPALSREEAKNKGKKDENHKDSRNLYLIKEGLIMAGSKAAEGVSSSDMAKRHKIEQTKGQVLKNLNRFVSRNRLSIHNLPLDYNDEKLKDMVIKYTNFKPHECRIIRENKPSVGYPLGKSKGFGFMSFKSHKEALLALRKLNNNPSIFGNQNRPIVGFSIEDRSVHNVKKKRLEKSRQNNPFFKEKLEKLKAKKQQKLQKDNKSNIQIMKNNTNKNHTNSSTQPDKCIDEDFMGIPAKPGNFVRTRSTKKIREQTLQHKKKLSLLKQKNKKEKERKQLRIEKKAIDRPKKGKKKLEKDSFSLLVNKYKSLLVPKSGNETNKPRKKKWYTE